MATLRSWLVLVGVLAFSARGMPASAGDEGEGGYAGKPVSWWVAELGSRDTERAEIARSVIREIGPPAFPDLAVALDDPTLRLPALRAMDVIRGPVPDSLLPLLLAKTDDSNSGVRSTLARLFGQMGPSAAPALPFLVKCLDDRDPSAAMDALRAVAALGPSAAPAIPHVLPLLDSSRRDVRYEAIRSLGRIGADDDRAVAALVRIARDDVFDARRAAVQALGEASTRYPVAVALLRAVLAEPHSTLVMDALDALGKLGARTPLAVEALLAAPDELALTDLRARAVGGLRPFASSDPRVVPALIARLADRDVRVRQEAASVLGALGRAAEPAIPAMVSALDSQTDRQWAETALRSLRPWSTPHVLEAVLRGSDWRGFFGLLMDLTPDEVALASRVLPPLLRDPNVGPEARLRLVNTLRAGTRQRAGLVPVLLLAIPHSDVEVARAVADVLAAQADAEPVVRELMSSPDVLERRTALEAMDRWPDPRVWVEDLKAALVDADRGNRVLAAQALAMPTGARHAGRGPTPDEVGRRFAAPMIPVLAEGLEDPDPAIRQRSAFVLSSLHPHATPALPALERALDDPKPEVARAVASALMCLPDGVGASVIENAIGRLRPTARVMAAQVLGDRRFETAVHVLVESLDSEDRAVRVLALRAIAGGWSSVQARMPPAPVVRGLLQGDEEEGNAALLAWHALPASADALNAVSGPLRAGEVPGGRRDQVVQTLHRWGEAAVSLLVDLLGKEEASLRVAALASLRTLGPKAAAAIPAIEDAARDPNAGVAATAASTLKAVRKD